MKIEKLETFFVQPRWMFLKITTDEGLCGWGEPIVEGRARTVAMAIREYEPVLIGADPRRIEDLWQLMYRGTFYRGGPILCSAISGIEQALWDIKGKYYGLPVYEMLGGPVRERVRMYSHILKFPKVDDEAIRGAVESARTQQARGFTAIKYSIYPPVKPLENRSEIKQHVKLFAAIREAVGDEMDIALDLHGRVTPQVAIRLARELEPYFPMFLEEPCLPENVDTMVTIARSTSIPIATGERLFTKFAFREPLQKQAAQIVQPDLCHCGGIFEGRKIAAMAETNYASFAPHNPLGPISLASCLQLDACTPNFIIQEYPGLDSGWDRGVGYLKTPFQVVDGYIAVPKGPGLGIEVDEDVLAERAYPGDWDTPHMRHGDGSVADW